MRNKLGELKTAFNGNRVCLQACVPFLDVDLFHGYIFFSALLVKKGINS